MLFFIVPLLALHLMAVNLAAAGPLVCLAIEWWGRRRGNSLADEVARRLAMHALAASLVGASLGGLMLWRIWQHPHGPVEANFLAAVGRLAPAKLYFSGGELAFYAVCMAAYLALWRRPWRSRGAGRFTHRALAVLAATNLLYHFPPLFVALSILAGQSIDAPPWHVAHVIDAAAYRELVFTSAVGSRALHHVCAALAAAGLYGAWLAARNQPSVAAALVRPIVALSARIALTATLLQIPVGVWVLLALPRGRSLMGVDVGATSLFVAGVLSAFALMHKLADLAFAEPPQGGERRRVLTTAALLALTTLLMVAALKQT